MGCSDSKAVEYTEIINLCEYPGVVFKEEIKLINGSNRNVASWLPEEVPIKAVIIVSHGLNEHILRYAGIAIELVKRGYAVHGIDHVSHGKSDGRRSVIADHKVLYEDFIAFGNDVHAQYPTLPLFLLAHSMGTLVGMMSINRIPDLRAVVLSGPAIFGGPGSSSPFGIRCLYPLSQTSFAVCLTSVTSSLDPAGPAAPLVASEISSDPAELELIRHDPRMAPPVITNKSAYSLVKLIAEVKAEIPNIKLPFLCIHGAQDTIALPKSSDYVVANSGTDQALKSMHIFADAKHEPFHEVAAIKEASIAYVVAYFEAQYQQVVDGAKGLVVATTPEGMEGSGVVGVEVAQEHAALLGAESAVQPATATFEVAAS